LVQLLDKGRDNRVAYGGEASEVVLFGGVRPYGPFVERNAHRDRANIVIIASIGLESRYDAPVLKVVRQANGSAAIYVFEDS